MPPAVGAAVSTATVSVTAQARATDAAAIFSGVADLETPIAQEPAITAHAMAATTAPPQFTSEVDEGDDDVKLRKGKEIAERETTPDATRGAMIWRGGGGGGGGGGEDF